MTDTTLYQIVVAMTVSIITHVYGPFYITLLAEQLRSLARFRDATATVLFWQEESHLIWEATDGIDAAVNWHALDWPELCNRIIGRNLAAKRSTADWVWFTDCDYLFGPGCLEAVDALNPHAACMYYPKHAWRPRGDSKHNANDGDYFDDWKGGEDPFPHFVQLEKQKKAIGGIQIVPGDLARTYGYLDGLVRYHRPATAPVMGGWHGDKKYRNWLADKTGLPIMGVDIPGVYRIRHRIPETSDRHALLPMGATDATGQAATTAG